MTEMPRNVVFTNAAPLATPTEIGIVFDIAGSSGMVVLDAVALAETGRASCRERVSYHV